MLDKPEYAERLLAYTSERLDRQTAREVEAHLANCARCRGFVARQASVWEALDQWQAPPVSGDFDRRLYQRIQHEVSWWDRLLRPLRPLALHRGLPIAATAGLVVIAGLLMQRPAPEPASVPKSAQVEASEEQLDRAVDDMEILRDLNHVLRADSAAPTM